MIPFPVCAGEPGPEAGATGAAGRLEERLAQGKSAVLLGVRSPSLLGAGLVPVRVDLGGAGTPLELGRRLLACAGHVLGVHPGRWLQPQSGGLAEGVRTPVAERSWGASLLSALQDLAERAPGRAVLVLEGADEAAEDVQNLASALIARAQGLGIPALLTTASLRPSGGPGNRLLAAVLEREGEEALMGPRTAELGRPEADAVPAEARRERPAQGAGEKQAGGAVSGDLRRVLRVLATAPRGAAVDALAALVGTSPLAVLEALQRARDLGVPVLDAGGGAVALPPDLALALREELLPSLVDGYARQLAELQRQAPLVASGSEPSTDSREDVPLARAPAAAVRAAQAPVAAGGGGAAPQAAAPPDPGLPPDAELPPDAGLPPDAVAELVRQVDEAGAMGLFGEAAALGERALAQLDGAEEPAGSARRVEVLVRLARAYFLGAGTRVDGDGTGLLGLERALACFEAAEAALRPEHPVELACEAQVLKAEVLYELGTPGALEAALSALRSAGERYLKSGQPLRAARLLNEEAAVYVRRGELGRARQLLGEARAVFGELDPRRVDVRAEQAQTEHALARLALHSAASGEAARRELEHALECAQRAEILYAGLDFDRQLARVHETIGRLERGLGNARRAEAALLRAARAQQQRPDALGLARTAGALGELYAGEKRAGEALGLLARSVQLNAAIGSPRGLAYSREALGRIAAQLGPESSAACSRLLEQIGRAELALGKSLASGPAAVL